MTFEQKPGEEECVHLGVVSQAGDTASAKALRWVGAWCVRNVETNVAGSREGTVGEEVQRSV